jgi:hypothetical protein
MGQNSVGAIDFIQLKKHYINIVNLPIFNIFDFHINTTIIEYIKQLYFLAYNAKNKNLIDWTKNTHGQIQPHFIFNNQITASNF